jgi:hypothetical protein
MTSAPYIAPSAGVITELRGTLGADGMKLAVKVVRPTGTPTVLGTTPLLTVPTANAVVSTDVRIPVQAGDGLGV